MNHEGPDPSFLFFALVGRDGGSCPGGLGRGGDPPVRAGTGFVSLSFTTGVSLMNLVDTIKNQLFSDGHLNKLSELIGAGESATKSAVGAAVPALLSALSNVASSGRGAEKVVSALGNFDAGSLGNTAHMLAGHADSVLEQGKGLLNSLLGGNLVSGIANAVSRFAGIGSGAVQKLL